MHSVNLSDQDYRKALHIASERGFANVEEFLSSVIDEEGSETTASFDHLFTAEVLASIDQGAEDAKAGRVFSIDAVESHLAQWREEWRRNQAR